MSFQPKILVIENDQLSLKKIQKDLSSKGYEVCCIDNGAAGIKKALEYDPDLIVCNVGMEPISGFQVLEILKQSALTDRIPFIFMSSDQGLPEIKKALSLGVDDYFIKPIDSSELIMSIENKLLKFKKLKEMGKSEYKKILETSPNGIFIFDGHILLEANPAFLKIFSVRQEDITSFTLAEFLEIQSLQKVKEHISQCLHGLEDTFHEEVTFTLRSGESFDGTLYISIFEKHIGYAYMTGLILLKNTGRTPNGSAISEVQNFFKSENINLPYSGVMKKNNGHLKNNLKDLFSEREKEVICLSMEGHPTKIIADKLSISDRTVEKHRANLMEKTNSNNMIEVIVYAIKNNLINLQ